MAESWPAGLPHAPAGRAPQVPGEIHRRTQDTWRTGKPVKKPGGGQTPEGGVGGRKFHACTPARPKVHFHTRLELFQHRH